MGLIRINKTFCSKLFYKARRQFSSGIIQQQENDEYTAVPQYPPILDLSYKKILERKEAAIHDEIKQVKTVEEKQIKINMPRYYGFRSYMLPEYMAYYNQLPLTQHITRTHIIHNDNLPAYYDKIVVGDVQSIAEDIQEALLMEIDGFQEAYDLKNEKLSDVEKENLIGSTIVYQIDRILNYSLAQKFDHVFQTEADIDPRLESAWYVGGIDPTLKTKKFKEKNFTEMKDYANDPVDRLMYYIGSPNLTIRADQPLPQIITSKESENSDFEIPFYRYDPRVLGIVTEHRPMANIPGFWPGASHTFGITAFLQRGYLTEREKEIRDANDNKEALHRQAILSSFAWLHSQANYLGFTTFNDITYPLVTQTVITNGKHFNFYIYQLNTILLNTKYIYENPKKNICWISKDFKLYEAVENGKIIGFNEQVLKNLIKLYSNAPTERQGVNLTPYLSENYKLAADYEDAQKREWLEREYKHLTSNRPRFKEIDEIYSWEKIYKIDHNTRFMDKRLRFFELFKRPETRKLNDRLPRYIPRALRPHLPRHKGRYGPEFWP